jgi:hypothetical protein
MEQLWKHKLYLQLDQCEFEQTWIEYLGLIILEGQAEMDPVKVAGIADWPKPLNKKEVQLFLSFTNFYWQFIQYFSHHAWPLFDLTGKNAPWMWAEAQQTAFNELKCAITSLDTTRKKNQVIALVPEAVRQYTCSQVSTALNLVFG